jgi:hypothetical protein
MQAIETKYMGPTNYRGSRIKATAYAGSITISYDDALSPEENHLMAAKALMAKFGWKGKLAGGGNPKGTGNYYVMIGGDTRARYGR